MQASLRWRMSEREAGAAIVAGERRCLWNGRKPGEGRGRTTVHVTGDEDHWVVDQSSSRPSLHCRKRRSFSRAETHCFADSDPRITMITVTVGKVRHRFR